MEIEIDPAWPEWAAKRPVSGELPGAPFASLATGVSRACRIGTAFAALVLDVDGRENAIRLIDASDGGALRWPNWMVERRARCGLHPVWCLARPALRGALAAPRPLRAFGRIAEYSAEVGSADPGYRAMHAHRLFARADGPRLQTTLGRRELYALDELAGGAPARQAQEPDSESRAAAAQPGRRSAVHRLAPMMSAISRWGRSGSVLS